MLEKREIVRGIREYSNLLEDMTLREYISIFTSIREIVLDLEEYIENSREESKEIDYTITLKEYLPTKEQGQGLVEYAIIIVMLMVVLLIVLSIMGMMVSPEVIEGIKVITTLVP